MTISLTAIGRTPPNGDRVGLSDHAGLGHAVTELVATHAAQRTAAVLDQFAEERGPHGRAVEGVAETLAALAVGRAPTPRPQD